MTTAAVLQGLRVLDLSRVLAGPYCTMMMADLGADVIKVEPPQGDDTRRFGPPFVRGESTYFLSINRGKRSLVLDLKTPEAQGVVQDLAAWADILVHNFRPGDESKLGVDRATLQRENPRLVYVSISGYGQRGDANFCRLPGYDLVIQGVGGVAALTGPPDGMPYKSATSIADLVAGMNAFGGALAGLWARQQTGSGRHVDISMQDGQLALLTYLASSYLNTGAPPQRLGNAHPSICPYQTFAASDGYFNLACGNDSQFRALCVALQVPAWAQQEAFATNAARVAHRDELVPMMQALFQKQPVNHWLLRVQNAGVPCGPIDDVPAALQHPQVKARDMLLTHTHVTAGPVHSVGTCVGAALQSQASRPPPSLGEHTDEVLREVLGYDADHIAALRQAGAIAVRLPPA